ncbi:MAG: hypothetical protein ACQESR_11450 [Planctomycetota bacterium]
MRQRPILTVAVSIPLLVSTIAIARPLAVPGDVDSPRAGAAHGARLPELNGPVAPPAVQPSATDIQKSSTERLNGAERSNKRPSTKSAAESGVEDEPARPERTTASSTAASGRHANRRQPTWRPTQADAKAPEPPLLLARPVATAETPTEKAETASPVDPLEPTEPKEGEPGLLPIQKDAVRELKTSQDVRAFLSNPESDGETPRLAKPNKARQDANQNDHQQRTSQAIEAPEADGGVAEFLERKSSAAESDSDAQHLAGKPNAEHRQSPSSGRRPPSGQPLPGKKVGSPPSPNTSPVPEGAVADESPGDMTPSASTGIELAQPRSDTPPGFNRDQDAIELSRDNGDVGALLRRSPQENAAEESGNSRPERLPQPGTRETDNKSQLAGPPAEGDVADGQALGDGEAAAELELAAESPDDPQPAKQEQAGAEKAKGEIPEAEEADGEEADAEEGDAEDGEGEEAAGTTNRQPEGAAPTNGDEKSVPDKPEQFSPRLLRLRDGVRECLTDYYQRPENVHQRSPWGIMHDVMAYGVDTELQAGRDRVNAIGWLCYNRPCRQLKLFQFDGRYPVPRNGPGYQGHKGQFLSMLALSRVKSTYPMRVDGRDLTVQDLIEYEKATCRSNMELTFKLIGLAHYLPSEATWRGKRGRTWSISRLLQEELAQPINGAACGGTHRLIGYSVAVRKRLKGGEPLEGQWLRAHKYVDAYHKHAVKLQNRDGSFSTNWFKGRGAKRDVDRRVQTTGHILEWLVFSLPKDELTDPRIVRAVTYLNTMMLKYRRRDWESGHRGHALRALALYNERVFGDEPGERRDLLAQGPVK